MGQSVQLHQAKFNEDTYWRRVITEAGNYKAKEHSSKDSYILVLVDKKHLRVLGTSCYLFFGSRASWEIRDISVI